MASTSPGIRVSPLSNESAAQFDGNLVVEIDHSALTVATADTGQTLTPFTLKAGETLQLIRSELLTPFEDTTDAASLTTTITCGDAGSAARYLASQELNRNGTEVLTKAGTGTIYAPTANTPVTVTVGAPTSGKNIAAYNRGLVRLVFRLSRPYQSL
jgi:hypothetical protein